MKIFYLDKNASYNGAYGRDANLSQYKRKFVLHLSKLAHTAFECEAYLFPVLFLSVLHKYYKFEHVRGT